MSGIVIAALVTAAAAALVWGTVILRRAAAPDRGMLILGFLLQLPMSVAAYRLVRVPLDGALHAWLGDSAVYKWGRMLYAPITEEPAKLWPVLIPWIAARVSRANATHVAAALGVGFGVGEIGLLADFIRSDPQNAGHAWYAYSGFIGERFMVCLVHGLFVAMTILGWKCWRIGWVGGLALAMMLHFALNFPIAPARLGWLGSDPAIVSSLLSLWNAAFFIAAVLALLIQDRRMAGMPPADHAVTCPKCSQTFQRSLMPLNLGLWRLERCPHCRRWSLI